MARRTQSALVIAALCGETVLIADVLVPRSGHGIPLAYINAGILVLASAALAELVISSHHAHERLEALLALKTVSLTEIHHRVKNNLQIVSPCSSFNPTNLLILVFAMFSPNVATASNAMARLHEELYNEHGQSHRARIKSRDRHRAPQTQYGNHDAPSAQFTIGRRGGTSIHLNSPAAETDCARGAPKIVRRMQIIQAVGIAPTQRAFHQ